MKLAGFFSRPIMGALLAVAAFAATAVHPSPAQAQSIIRDTEVERVLRTYLDPLLTVAGLRPEAVHLYIVNDPSINAFVAEGQNIFVHTGMLLYVHNPNELKGVMAHETGHMAGGHLVRFQQGARAAMIPMLLSMALGVAAMAAGAPDAGSAILMGGQQIAERTFLAFSRTQEASADQAGVMWRTRLHTMDDFT